MPHFPGVTAHGSLVLQWVRKRTWRLVHGFRVTWSDGEHVVPAGLHTDLASIPRGFRWLVSVVGQWARASVVHDDLYVRQPAGWTRYDADRLFYELMRAEGVAPWRAWVMYGAVRAGGWWLW